MKLHLNSLHIIVLDNAHTEFIRRLVSGRNQFFVICVSVLILKG